MSIFTKIFEKRVAKLNSKIDQEIDRSINSQEFLENLEAVKEAIEAFKASKKESKDIGFLLTIIYCSMKSCYYGLGINSTGRFAGIIEDSVREKMHIKIMEFLK